MISYCLVNKTYIIIVQVVLGFFSFQELANDTEFNSGDWATNVDPDCNFYTEIVNCKYYTDNDFALKLKILMVFLLYALMQEALKKRRKY